jgi:hypothetical protein
MEKLKKQEKPPANRLSLHAKKAGISPVAGKREHQ